ncbi:DUF6037 family protein [Oceanobacillus sp. J11TS1]|uniref:DUF6037 family protein n=1 Tax=Oceanobacillus sp. J11TS1 TaxID=2807191 RepID=UPI001B2A84FB|nr:DUF6037 family protein [Oceanobacillus sp. J11TS1]GIO23003.1 hypothetical protein J11TS1_15840 [Oceanobacillus sp. J11TS1]
MTFKFKLPEIKPLLSDMGENNAKMDKFKFTYNNVEFEVIIFIDRKPYELLFGIIDRNFSFILYLEKGYKLSNLSKQDFYKLCEILNLKPGKETFTSFKFLKHVAKQLPTQYSKSNIEPHEIAWYKAKYVPEPDKIYFCGWRTYSPDSPHSAKNFEKTREFLGEKTYQFCKKNNISSRWTAEPKKRIDYYPPD